MKLSENEIQSALQNLKSWSLKEGKLHRELSFKNFLEAFGFMTQVALLAEQRDHHPEWFNVYNRVSIDLNTHSAGGITSKDTELASKINEIASLFEAR